MYSLTVPKFPCNHPLSTSPPFLYYIKEFSASCCCSNCFFECFESNDSRANPEKLFDKPIFKTQTLHLKALIVKPFHKSFSQVFFPYSISKGGAERIRVGRNFLIWGTIVGWLTFSSLDDTFGYCDHCDISENADVSPQTQTFVQLFPHLLSFEMGTVAPPSQLFEVS